MNKRLENREWCFSRVLINQVPGQLRDINQGGIKVALIQELDLPQDEDLEILIIPEDSLRLPSFCINGSVKWKRQDPFGTLLGIQISPIVKGDKKDYFEMLLSYYRQQSS